jgi:hypothetical protein
MGRMREDPKGAAAIVPKGAVLAGCSGRAPARMKWAAINELVEQTLNMRGCAIHHLHSRGMPSYLFTYLTIRCCHDLFIPVGMTGCVGRKGAR